MKIKTILILVELDNGAVHQVLTTKEQKEICLTVLRSEQSGSILLSDRVEPIMLEEYKPKNG